MISSVRRIFLKECGQGVVEYAVLIAFVLVASAFLFGNPGIKNEVSAIFGETVSALK